MPIAKILEVCRQRTIVFQEIELVDHRRYGRWVKWKRCFSNLNIYLCLNIYLVFKNRICFPECFRKMSNPYDMIHMTMSANKARCNAYLHQNDYKCIPYLSKLPLPWITSLNKLVDYLLKYFYIRALERASWYDSELTIRCLSAKSVFKQYILPDNLEICGNVIMPIC